MDKVKAFHDDLSVALSEVRAVLNHWHLQQWQEYLVVRLPGKPESFVVLANEKDTGDFAERLRQFHQEQAAKETPDA